MNYRLFVDLEALSILDVLTAKVRRRVLDHLVRLRSSPEQLSASHTHDGIGRRIEISVIAGLAIYYWIDIPDRHVKVLMIRATG